MSTQVLHVAGVDVFVEGTGAQTVVMVHGWPDTHRLWDATVAALADRFRCCRFTLPGFEPGASGAGPDPADVATLLPRIVDAVSPQAPVILLLHDWGCFFGYQYAMRHPDRVSRIVGVDIGDMDRLQHTLPKSHLLGIAAYQLWLALAWKLRGSVGDAMTRWLARKMRVPADPATLHASMNWPYAMTWLGGKRSLARGTLPFRPHVPMLYAWGRRKPFMFHSPDWPAAVSALPGGRAVPFDTGHWVMLDAPERFHALLREWLPAGG